MKRTHTTILLGVLFIAVACVARSALGADDATTLDAETIKKWSAPYRGWHYYPEHVIPSRPNIKGFEDV